MTFDATVQVLGLSPDPATISACHFLESRGLQFCVDFGTENALNLVGIILEDLPTGRYTC